MSVTVKHLNADSTFLLIFSPFERPSPAELRSVNGAYTVLVDPWLTGSSIVNAKWFANTVHVIPPCIEHLSQIDEPDVVLVSQNKPDHCHKETLLQLRPEGKTIVVAEPGAAKVIKTWNHFDPTRVHGMDKYNPKKRFGDSLRLHIPPLSPVGHPGELHISFIPAKNYMTGLHNAFGITYQPPTQHRTLASVSTFDLQSRPKYFHLPMSRQSLSLPSSPPASPPLVRPSKADTAGPAFAMAGRPRTAGNPVTRPGIRSQDTASANAPASSPYFDQHLNSTSASVGNTATTIFEVTPPSDSSLEGFHFSETVPTPPDSPASSMSSGTYQNSSPAIHQRSSSSVSTMPVTLTPGRPKALSILYTPHGIPLADLKSYVETHLVKIGALPLTLLLQAFGRLQNPLLLGGNIMSGMPGGVQIARALMARCWVSAHDEDKDDRGFAVTWSKHDPTTPEEIRRELWRGTEGEWLRKHGWMCDVRNLDVGGELFIGAQRDLLIGGVGGRGCQRLAATNEFFWFSEAIG